jgi:hypothetical protein
MTTWRSAKDLPPAQRRRNEQVQRAIRAEREQRDDTPEGEDRRWGPKKRKPRRRRREERS